MPDASNANRLLPQPGGSDRSERHLLTAQLNLLDLAFELRDEGQQRVTDASDDQDIAVVDQAIKAVAERGRPFSANDVRPLLPELGRRNLIGARFTSLRKAKVIRRHKLDGQPQYVPSNDPGTHGHPIAVWVSGEITGT